MGETSTMSATPARSHGGKSKMILSESPSVSDVTLAEYNRWVVERENKQVAEERRAEMEREREARSKMEQEWKARGMARFTENKDQTAVSRRARESLEKRNHLRGTHVKDEKQQWKQQAKTEVDAFMEKSQQQCKDFGSDLKRKIAETKKNLTERNRQLFNDVKAELKAYQDIRDDRQQQFLASQKERRDQIRDMQKVGKKDAEDTKGFAAEKKKTGELTRAQVKAWRDQKAAMMEAHAVKATRHKDGIAAAKAAAKTARTELEAKRRAEAVEIRNHKTKLATENADMSKEQEKMNRIKHNEIKVGRYVPPELAKAVKDDTTFTDAVRYANEHKDGK